MMARLFLLTIALLIGLFTCQANDREKKDKDMFGLFKKQHPIEKFWDWFTANEKRLRQFEADPNKYLNELITNAKKIERGLAIELEPPQKGIINMTISADGNKLLFPLVQSIVAKAPKIDGWNIIAFRQRMPKEYVVGIKLKAENHEMDPAKMKFFPVITGDTIDVIIYLNGVTEENFNQVGYGCLLLVDNILGEYDCVTKIRSYDFHNMPVKKEELEGLLPLMDLAAYIDKFHASKKHTK